jgi:hypothetical protein
MPATRVLVLRPLVVSNDRVGLDPVAGRGRVGQRNESRTAASRANVGRWQGWQFATAWSAATVLPASLPSKGPVTGHAEDPHGDQPEVRRGAYQRLGDVLRQATDSGEIRADDKDGRSCRGPAARCWRESHEQSRELELRASTSYDEGLSLTLESRATTLYWSGAVVHSTPTLERRRFNEEMDHDLATPMG